MGTTNPRLLNLDDVELLESDMKIRHEGVDHAMAILTVDKFIAQQRRAADHQKMVAAGKAEAESNDPTDIVTLMRDAIAEFFPTLPVGELPTAKLFTVFAWLNEMSAQLNSEASEGIEGNEQEGETDPQ